MDEKEDQPPADEDEYVPSVREEEPSDETNEMYNLSADEAAADEMETFLASLEKSDTGAELRKELKAKLEVASTKLADLFKKQQLLNEEEERAAQEAIEKELQQAQKEMPVQTQAEEKTAKKQDTLKYIMLQKKANSLMNDVELAEQKSRSVTLQWALDKERFKAELKQKQVEMEALHTRLNVMERKARSHEQVHRDPNMVRAVDGGPAVNPEDIEMLREELQETQAELEKKLEQLHEMSKSLNEANTDRANAELRVELLTARVEDLVKGADTMHDHLEGREKDESNLAKQHKASLLEIAELVKEVHREQAAVKALEDELAVQKAEHEQIIAGLGLESLQARVAQLEAEKGEIKEKFSERERELKRSADHSRIEKEQIARENKNLSLAINKVAYMTKAITAEFETHRAAAEGKIDTEMKKSNTMFAEIKALSKNIDNVAGDALKRAKEMEARVEQQKRAADIVEMEFQHEREKLELRVSDLQKDAANKEKVTKTKIAQAVQAEVEAKEAAQKELAMANMVIDKLNGQIDTLRKTGGGSHSASKDTKPAGADKHVAELEAEKEKLTATIAARDAALAKAKEDIGKVDKLRKTLEEDIEAERERYDELKKDHREVQDELDRLEQQLAAKSGGNPQSAEQLHQREVTRLKEELSAAKKDSAAKAKEIKTLIREKEKAEKSGEKKASKKDEPKPAHVPKPKRPKQAKTTIASDSESDEDVSPPPSAPSAQQVSTETFDTAEEEPEITTVSGSRLPSGSVTRDASFQSRQDMSTKIELKAGYTQTEATLDKVHVDKPRVETILRQAIQTDNYYYSKQTGTFTNVYPVEEHLMDDLIDSFHAMSQDMLGVLKSVAGLGSTPLESSFHGAVTPKMVADNLEAMILKGAKDLIINLEKSKERNFKKLVEEQRGKMENLTGALDSDIAYAKEEAVMEATEKFQEQMSAVMQERIRLEQQLEEVQDLLAVERAKVLEATMGGGVVPAPRSGDGSESDAEDESEGSEGEDSFAEGEEGEEDEEELGDEAPVQDADASVKTTEAAPASRGSERVMSPPGQQEGSVLVGEAPEGGSDAQLVVTGSSRSIKAVANAKINLMNLRKKKEARQKSTKEEQKSTGDPAPVTVEGTTPSPAGSKPPSSKGSRRKNQKTPVGFDELDTGETILKRLTAQQVDDLKTLVLQELTEEVKRGLEEKERLRAEKEAADAVTNHHVSRDVHALKEDLLEGKLQHIGEVRVSDFDRLRNKLFGSDDLISLTIVEHHVRYGSASDAYDDEESQEGSKKMSKEEAKKHAFKRRQYRMLIRSMVLQRELLQKNVVTTTPLLTLLKYKHATEVAHAQLTALSAWRALNYYRGGGVFRDVLSVHLEVIDKCITAAGGWQAALAEIENAADPQLDMDTAQWPEFFRVRVLEVLRARFAEELDRTKVRLQTSGTFQQPYVEYVQSNDVLPFDQIMSTEANKKRMDMLTRDASSRAVELMGNAGFSALNRSVKKLKVAAAASFLAYTSSRAEMAQRAEEEDSGTPGSEEFASEQGDVGGFSRQNSSMGNRSDSQPDTMGFTRTSSVTFAVAEGENEDGTSDKVMTGAAATEASTAEGAATLVPHSTGKHASGPTSAASSAPGSADALSAGARTNALSAGARTNAPAGSVPGGVAAAGLAETTTISLANNPLMTGKASTRPPVANSRASGGSASKKNRVDIVRDTEKPQKEEAKNAWLQEEDDEISLDDSIASSAPQPPAPEQKGAPGKAAIASAAGKGGKGKGKTGSAAGKTRPPAGATGKDATPADDLLHQLEAAFSAEKRPGSPGDESVVSNLSASTNATPAAPPAASKKAPASTKAQQLRESSKKASNALKFNKFDAVKNEEKKRKAAKAAEATAANQKAAGENMAKLAGSIGDMFETSDIESGFSGSESDAAGGSLKLMGSQSVSDTEKNALGGNSKPGTAGSANDSAKLAPDNFQWMHVPSDKLVLAALYGDEAAMQVMHCVVDSIGHWEAGQPATAAVVLKAAIHTNFVPELLTELAQRADRRNVKIAPEILELRNKLANIMSFVAKMALDDENRQESYAAQEQTFLPHHAPLVPHISMQHAHQHGQPAHSHSPSHGGSGFAAFGSSVAHSPSHSHGPGHSPAQGHAQGYSGLGHHPGPGDRSGSPGHHPHHPVAQPGGPNAVDGTPAVEMPLELQVHHIRPEPHQNAFHHPHGHGAAPHAVHAAHPAYPVVPQTHAPQATHTLPVHHAPHSAHHGGHAPYYGAIPLGEPPSFAPYLPPVHGHSPEFHKHQAPDHGSHAAHHGHVRIERENVPSPSRPQLGHSSTMPSSVPLTHTTAAGAPAGGNVSNAQQSAAAAGRAPSPTQMAGAAMVHPPRSSPPHSPQQPVYTPNLDPTRHIFSPTHLQEPSPASDSSAHGRRASVAVNVNYGQGMPTFHPSVQRYPGPGGPIPQGPAATQFKSPTNRMAKRKVPMFDNSTQTAHGSIQLQELTSEVEDAEKLSSLVKSLILDGWEDKIKKNAKRKKETHTVITSAMAVPATFIQTAHDPFAKKEDTSTIFKGFEHAYFDEAEFEVQPGVRLASAHRVATAVRQFLKAEKEAATKRRESQFGVAAAGKETSAGLGHDDDMHIGCWTMQTNIRYCIRNEGVEYGKRLKRVPFFVKVPIVPGCEAVIFPNVFPVQQGVNLITGEKSGMGRNLALPEDVLLLQVAEDTVMPPGLTQVLLSPMLKLSSSLQQFMQRAHPLPPGHHLVQLTEQSAVSLPDGVEVRSGVTVVATPPELDLPSNVIVVKNPLNDDLPEYMHKLSAVTNEEDDLIAEMKLNEFCCVLKRPAGIDFGLGVEILQRPPGHPLPPGMTLLSVEAYPDGLVLPEELELVQLTPRFDFPLGCRLNAEWKVWPRPDGMRLPPGVQIVYPDSTAAVAKLPAGVCSTYMPDIPYGVTLPPNAQAVEIFGSAAGKYPLPEGAILAPGITVLACEGLIPQSGVAGNLGFGTATQRAVNVLLVHRMPGTPLPPFVERGSKADLPVGTLLAENMDIVRVAVRFELPPGVRIQAGAKLGPFTQIAPGTDLVTLSGGKPDADYSSTIRVLEWPHGVRLTPGTEFVRRPPAGYYLPVGYKEIVQPRFEVSSNQGGWAVPAIPDYGMLVELPRAIHYATAQNLAEHVTVGLESTLEGKIVTMPLGMVLASRDSRQCQWPAEMTPAPKSSLSINLMRMLDRMNSENNQITIEGGLTVQSFVQDSHASPKAAAPPKPTLHAEVVKLRPHYSLPPGCEIIPGVVVQRKPFWLHVPSGVELVTKHADASGRLLPFTCKGVNRVQLRPDYILTGAEVDMVTMGTRQSVAQDTAAAAAAAVAATINSTSTAATTTATVSFAAGTTDPGDKAPGSASASLAGPDVKTAKDWEMVDLEHTVKLSPTSLPDNYELVHVSELLESVHSWGPYLKGVEAVQRVDTEDGHPSVLPPLHFLIHRPLIQPSKPLPAGFQLSVAYDYATWEIPPLPPNIEIMHLVPTYHLPMGINIMNTSVLNKNQFNTVLSRGGRPPEHNIPQLQSGERISAGFSVIGKPFGSIAMAQIIGADPFYEEEAHAFVRVHDPRHFKLPKMMALDRHSDRVVESVFGAELPPEWRKGYFSKSDPLGGEISKLSESTRKPSAGAALQGELMITDIIKLVRLPHGFPAPRERQKRAQARFALLKPAVQKVSTIVRMRGAKALQDVPLGANAGATDGSQLEAPLQHTHTHHKKRHNQTGLVVYPRLLCIHSQEKPSAEDKKEKFLVNTMLNRLTESLRTAAKPGAVGVNNKKLSPAAAEKAAAVQMQEEAFRKLQDLLETEHVELAASKELTAKLEAEKVAATTALSEAKEKVAQYEKQLSYDEDLKVLIQRLNLKLKNKTVENEEIIAKGAATCDRMQAQIDLLNTQVARFQDLAQEAAAAAAAAEVRQGSPSGSPTNSPGKGSSTNLKAAGEAAAAAAAASTALSLEHLEKFSSTLHQQYRDQTLAGLERVSELYANSVNNIMNEFEQILINWPNWSPKEMMVAAIAWSRNHSLETSSSVGSQQVKSIELRIPSTDENDNQSAGLSPPKVSASLGVKVRAPSMPLVPDFTFEDDAEDVSVLSDTESMLHGGNSVSNASHTGSEVISVSGYQPRDLTRDAQGKPIPVTPGFALNVKGLYSQPAQNAAVDMLSITAPVSLAASASSSVTGGKSKRATKLSASLDLGKALHQPSVMAPPPQLNVLQLSHSLSDLFAKQRRSATPGKGQQQVGRLPKLIHNTTNTTPSGRLAEAEPVNINVRYFDPAVLGAGVNPLAMPGSSATSVTGGLVGAEEGMPVSADITAQEVAEFLRGDEHRVEIARKLQQTTAQMTGNLRRDFSALLAAVHSNVVSSIPTIIEQYKSAQGNDTNRGVSVVVEDYSKFSNSALAQMQNALNAVVVDATYLMRYALGAVLLHSNVSLQQADIEADALRHQLSLSAKRLEILDYLLQDARKKGTADGENSTIDVLKEKVLTLESRVERLLNMQIDPAVSVLSTLVHRLEDMSGLEKQLKFTALLFRQKAAKIGRRLQADKDLERTQAHLEGASVTYNSMSESEGEDDESFGIEAHASGTSPIPHRSPARIVSVITMPLEKNEVKALKHYSHNLRMKSRHCKARAQLVRKEVDELMACIMEHMEGYQRAAQKLLPAQLLEQVLRASVRSHQSVSVGAKLARAKAARGEVETTNTAISALSSLDRRDSADSVSLSGESVSSLASSLAASHITGGGSSNTSLTGSGLRVLKPIRGTEITLQRSMLDANRTLNQTGVKFGAPGSMPVASAQSHLLLRGNNVRRGNNFK